VLPGRGKLGGPSCAGQATGPFIIVSVKGANVCTVLRGGRAGLGGFIVQGGP